MTTTATQPKPNAACGEALQRLLTAADLDVFPSDLPSGAVRYELYDGRLIIMTPPGGEHGLYETRFAHHFYGQGELKGHGKACSGGTGLILSQNPDTVVGPDAAFFMNKSLPFRFSPDRYFLTVPELVVEVKSKNDTYADVKRKVELYLQAGVVVVWVADPKKKIVTEYRRDKETVLAEKDVLTVEDIIPGFQLPVRDVFAE